jgi:rhodanese-related sulfurtransferase
MSPQRAPHASTIMAQSQPVTIDLRSSEAYAKSRPVGAVHLQPQDLVERAYLCRRVGVRSCSSDAPPPKWSL